MFLKRLFSKKKKQTLWVYCPNCKVDLCSNDSFVKDTDFVYYKCKSCGHEIRWDFDRFGPVVVEVDENGLPKVTEATE